MTTEEEVAEALKDERFTPFAAGFVAAQEGATNEVDSFLAWKKIES